MKDAGYANHEVCAVTGHKNEGRIQSYDRLDRAGSHRPAEMADVLDRKAVSSAHQATSAVVQHVQSAESRKQPSHGGIVFEDQTFVQNLTVNYNINGSDEKLSSTSSNSARSFYNSYKNLSAGYYREMNPVKLQCGLTGM